ncbi:peroxide stress protein YaaA [Alphaproteobacteria bacterium]|nr:peroxide stress protein YaaA [Alphaproteobacteria bacterium]
MLAFISPAKKMNTINGLSEAPGSTAPRFLPQTEALVQKMQGMSHDVFKSLMGLSDKLTALNQERYANFDKATTAPAARLFAGDTYVGLDAETLSETDLVYAQNHLLILSGLYGLLRPLDQIKPHRLEMGTKLTTDRGSTLYAFWGNQLAEACHDAVAGHKDPTIVYLASTEYSKAVPQEKLTVPFVTCHFKENRDGTPKTIGLFAKRSRGMMARFMIQERVETVAGLKAFSQDGYAFMPPLSTETDLVFVR